MFNQHSIDKKLSRILETLNSLHKDIFKMNQDETKALLDLRDSIISLTSAVTEDLAQLTSETAMILSLIQGGVTDPAVAAQIEESAIQISSLAASINAAVDAAQDALNPPPAPVE